MPPIGLMVTAGRRMSRRWWPELNRSSQHGVVGDSKGWKRRPGLSECAAVVVEARPEGGPERR